MSLPVQGRQYILCAGEAKEDFRRSSSGTGQNHLVSKGVADGSSSATGGGESQENGT